MQKFKTVSHREGEEIKSRVTINRDIILNCLLCADNVAIVTGTDEEIGIHLVREREREDYQLDTPKKAKSYGFRRHGPHKMEHCSEH